MNKRGTYISKSKQFLKEDDAVDPVIGVILMVAITVILAAVIAAFVFGMGPPEQAPQASIRASAETLEGNISVVKLQHQGGDGIWMTSTSTRIMLSGATEGTVKFEEDLGEFTAGRSLYIYPDEDATTNTVATIATREDAETDADDDTAIAPSGQTITVNIVDVGSQQMIATMNVRF